MPSSNPRKPHPAKQETTSTITITTRKLAYTYVHLSLTPSHASPPNQNHPPLDILTAHTALTTALSSFLGLHGTAISIDILHLTTTNADTGAGEFWVRVPREEGDGVVAAVVGSGGGRNGHGRVLRVRGRGEWLGGVVMRGGNADEDVWKLGG